VDAAGISYLGDFRKSTSWKFRLNSSKRRACYGVFFMDYIGSACRHDG
jgi:hypothetical protein